MAYQRFGEETMRRLSGRAIGWYKQRGLFADAIETAIASMHSTYVADLIEQYMEAQHTVPLAASAQRFREVAALRRWLAYVPSEIIDRRPLLCLGQAMTLLFTGVMQQQPLSPRQRARLEETLQLAEQGFRTQDNAHWLAHTLIILALFERHYGSITRAVASASQAQMFWHRQEWPLKSLSWQVIGEQELHMGQIEKALQSLLAARTIFERLDAESILRANTSLLSRAYFEQGELRLAAEHYRQMLATARQEQDRDDISDAQLGLARISYEWNDLTAAEQQAIEALEQAKLIANEKFEVEAELLQARIEHAQGRNAVAQQRTLALLTRYPAVPSQELSLQRRLNLEIQTTLVWLQLKGGDLVAVERWIGQRSQHEGGWLPQDEEEDLLTIRLLLAREKAREALTLAQQVADAARLAGRIRTARRAELLLSLAYAASSQAQQSKQLLCTLAAQCSAEGFVRLFLDEGEAVATLLQALLPATHRAEQKVYLRRLLFAFAQQRGENTEHSGGQLLEPLSPQEQRVLRLLATGHTNAHIAGELIVSVNTVKAQVQSIYRKLGVHTRVEASEVARQLDLL